MPFERHPSGLHQREIEVLQAAARGLTARETADELGLGTETIKHYRRLLLATMDARNMTEAVHIAHLKNLLP